MIQNIYIVLLNLIVILGQVIWALTKYVLEERYENNKVFNAQTGKLKCTN